MKTLTKLFTFIGASFCLINLAAQNDIIINVDASTSIGTINPLWGDYWDLDIQFGYGPNAYLDPSPHVPYIEDPGFLSTMELVKPRSIKISVGSWVVPPHPDYFSEDVNVLQQLPTEFYRGENNLTAADDPTNYHFEYLDSLLDAVELIDAEAFLNFDYMPFTLAANQVPQYNPIIFNTIGWFDNEIRNFRPQSNEVYARVVRNTIRHTKGLFKGTKDYGITYYEVWNEPDHQFLGLLPQFWHGTEFDLFDMYAAIAAEIENDSDLANNVKIGCCSFAKLKPDNVQFAENFMIEIGANNTRLDFLSVHPYHDENIYLSLDTAKLSIAQEGIDLYGPNAELVNTEWGVLHPDALGFHETLEHDLRNFKDIILMLDRDVKFAHFVKLVENDETPFLPSLGIATVNPITPKITGIARAHMNQLHETPTRLAVESTNDFYALAGTNTSENKIVVVVPAFRPENGVSNNLELKVNNLPWGSDAYKATLYALSETDFDNNDYFKIIYEANSQQGDFEYAVNYQADQNSGRLYTLVLEKDASTSTINLAHDLSQVKIYPNPIDQLLTIEVVKPSSAKIEKVEIIDALGKVIKIETGLNRGSVFIDAQNWASGIYLVKTYFDEIVVAQKILKK